MLDKIKHDAEDRMQKCVANLKTDLSRLRTGRAHPSLLEHIKVDYYGNSTPLSQVANIAVSDARTLSVTPWEKTMVVEIEKAIRTADLGLNPVAGGQTIRVPLPPLSEERRREMIKLVKQEGEQARVSIRNIRRDANNAIKNLIKDKKINEDDSKRAEDQIQKSTDRHIADIDKILTAKEQELLEI